MAAPPPHQEVTVTACYFSMTLSLLPDTDVIFTTSRRFAVATQDLRQPKAIRQKPNKLLK